MLTAESLARTMATLTPMLTEGRTADEAEWAVEGYERWVVPPRIRADVGDADANRRWEDKMAADLRAALAHVPAADRWPFIVETVYMARLARVGHEALRLAQQVHEDGDQMVLRATADSSSASSMRSRRRSPRTRLAFARVWTCH